VIVHNTSVKHTKAGSIPRGLQIAWALGQMKNMWFWYTECMTL
jgi:hypothetical protein